MSRSKECPESIDGEHEIDMVEIEGTSDGTTVLLFACVHCEACGRLEINHADVEWTSEDEDEDEDE